MKKTINRDKAGIMNKKSQILSSFLIIIGGFNYKQIDCEQLNLFTVKIVLVNVILHLLTFERSLLEMPHQELMQIMLEEILLQWKVN